MDPETNNCTVNINNAEDIMHDFQIPHTSIKNTFYGKYFFGFVGRWALRRMDFHAGTYLYAGGYEFFLNITQIKKNCR